jgi:uncharacterized membrane protein
MMELLLWHGQDQWWGGGIVFFFLALILFFIVLKFWFFRGWWGWYGGPRGYYDGRHGSAEEILRRRLARGEIDDAEYKRLRDILEK